MNYLAIEGKTRESLGAKDAKKLRKEGKVPCVVYGGDENLHFYSYLNE